MNEAWESQSWGSPRSVVRGWFARVIVTGAVLVGGLVGLILYLAFWGGHFPWYQNLAIVLSTLLLVPVVVVLVWLAWAVGAARRARAWMGER